MGKQTCASKNHFTKCVTTVEGKPPQVTWQCDHCGKHVIMGKFNAARARIHLAANYTKKLCANLCTSSDDNATERRSFFQKLIRNKEAMKQRRIRKRKWQKNRLAQRGAGTPGFAKKAKLQANLKAFLDKKDGAAVDYTVAQWAVG